MDLIVAPLDMAYRHFRRAFESAGLKEEKLR